MTEYPVFIPYQDDYLSAVITVPDEPAVGMVLFLTGTGAPRSHRFKMWTRAARQLAGQDVASVRVDYHGIGDSSGRLLQPTLGDGRREQGIIAARFAMEAVGVSRLIVAGNCSGGIVALGVAAMMPECEGGLLILPRVVQRSGMNAMAVDARKSRFATIARSNRVVHRLLRRSLSGGKDRLSPPVAEALEPALDHARLLFVYSEHDKDPYVTRSRRILDRIATELSPSRRARFDLRLTQHGPLSGFEAPEIQDEIVELTTSWIVESLARSPEGTPAPASTSRP